MLRNNLSGLFQRSLDCWSSLIRSSSFGQLSMNTVTSSTRVYHPYFLQSAVSHGSRIAARFYCIFVKFPYIQQKHKNKLSFSIIGRCLLLSYLSPQKMKKSLRLVKRLIKWCAYIFRTPCLVTTLFLISELIYILIRLFVACFLLVIIIMHLTLCY